MNQTPSSHPSSQPESPFMEDILKRICERGNCLDSLCKLINCSHPGADRQEKIQALRKYLKNILANLSTALQDSHTVNVLLVAGILQPLTSLDWSIDRTRGADAMLGLKLGGLSILQREIGNHIKGENHVHLHKGPGDGQYMRELAGRKGGEKWVQKGIADKLYFNPENILEKHCKADSPNDIFSQKIKSIFYQVVRKALQKKWYTGQQWDREREQKALFCDPNDINRLSVEDLRGAFEVLVKNDYFWSKSLMFEDESHEHVDAVLYAWIFKMMGYDMEDIRIKLRSEKRLKILDTELQRDSKLLGQLTNILPRLNRAQESELDTFRSLLIQFCGENIRTHITDIRKTQIWLQGKIKELKGSIRERSEREAGKTICCATPEEYPFWKEGYGLKDFVDEYFDSDVLQGIHSDGTIPGAVTNLIPSIEPTRFESIDLGYFEDIPLKYGESSIDLISATRSDSHENDEQFKNDIEGCIRVLNPGGILITDGCYASYSEIERYDLIHTICKNRSDVRVYVIKEEITGKPKSILIQKGKPRGKEYEFSSMGSLNNAVDSHHELISGLKSTVHNPLIIATNSVRRNLLALAGGQRTIFGPIREKILRVINRLPCDMGVELLKKAPVDRRGKIDGTYHDYEKDYGDCVAVMSNMLDGIKTVVKNLTTKLGTKRLTVEDFNGAVNRVTGSDDPARELIKKFPGFFFSACSDNSNWDNLAERAQKDYFAKRNTGAFRTTLQYSEAYELLCILDKIIRTENDDSIQKMLQLVSSDNPEETNKREVFRILSPYSSINPAEYIWWLQMRRDFFQKYMQRCYQTTRKGIKRTPLAEITEQKLLQLFFDCTPQELDIIKRELFYKQRKFIPSKNLSATISLQISRILNQTPADQLPVGLPKFNSISFAPLFPGETHTFPCPALQTSSTNRHRKNAPGCVPNNQHIRDKIPETDKVVLRGNISRLTQQRHPILLIHPSDCSTNKYLYTQLTRLVDSNSIRELHIDGDIKGARNALVAWAENGGIIILGGSHEDAYGAFGKEFTREIVKICLEITRRRNNVGIFATCFGLQTLVQGLNIGETIPGMMEIGAYGIRPQSSVLSDFGDMAVAMSHTGHIVLGNERLTGSGYTSLATNTLTNQPVGIMDLGRRIIGAQFHTEIPTDNEEVIRGFIGGFPGNFWVEARNKYGIGPNRATANFKTAQGNTGEIIAPTDIGDILLARFLSTISSSIITR